MFTEKDVLSFEFFKYGGVFSGSFDHMEVRYRITRIGEKPDFSLKAWIWKGPDAYDIVSASAPDSVLEETFPYSEEGRVSAAGWISEKYEELKGADAENQA